MPGDLTMPESDHQPQPQLQMQMHAVAAAAGSSGRGDGPSWLAARHHWPAAARVACGLVLFGMLWLAYLQQVALTPPTDVIEQLTWVRALEWGYYKHPPLPTWLLWLPVQLFGLAPGVAYALGAVCTLGALWLMWRLMVDLRGRRFADVALLAALCISYYNNRLYYYNHNVVMLLASSAAAFACWRAYSTRRLRWWLALGASLGLGALAKYQIALTVLALLGFATRQRLWHDAAQRRGLLAAAALASALFAPHLLWLVAHDFAPLGYAMSSSLGVAHSLPQRLTGALQWSADQLLNRGLPALLLLGIAAWSARGAPRGGAAAPSPATAETRAARELLLWWGWLPLLATTLLGVATGAELQLHWGTAFVLFTVPATMELLWRRIDWRAVRLRPLLAGFLAIQLLLLTINYASAPRGPQWLPERHWRHFESQKLADAVLADPAVRRHGTLRVIAGPASIAGALALRLPQRPLVLIDGRFDRSPWVPAELVQRCGMLQLDVAGVGDVPADDALTWRIVEPAADAAPCPDDALR